MSEPIPDFFTILVFFVYGLAFFSMGLAMMLESRRSPLLAEARVLRPLAFFGLVHGTHEWLEIFIKILDWYAAPPSVLLLWMRLVLLVLSFAALIYFGVQTFLPAAQGLFKRQAAGLLVFLAVYASGILLIAFAHKHTFLIWLDEADTLARYLLAVPGAALAGIALNRQSRLTQVSQDRRQLVFNFNLAALGFIGYALTQTVVAQSDLLPSRFLNQAIFTGWFGFPIQVVRAGLAVLITTGLIRASLLVEDERRRQFLEVQRARLAAMQQVQSDLKEKEALRQDLLRHTVLAQEDERARIARELHDETAQFLTALTLNLAALHEMVGCNPAASQAVERLQELGREMSQGIHRMVHDLRPAQLDDLGLVAALKYLADDAQRQAGLRVEVQITGARRRLDPLAETVLFRIAQEALTNVIRHADTTQARLLFNFEAQAVRLVIEDQGKGFQLNSPVQSSRLGLAGMVERAASLGGSLRLDSLPGRGTIVEASVPAPQATDLNNEEYIHESNSPDAGG